jgi:uncharacterized protein (TIGR02302 family)
MHRERLLSGLTRLRLSMPRSLLPRRDPWALRAALLLVLVLALVDAGGDVPGRLASAFRLNGPAAAAVPPPSLGLWVTPPGYTRRPPLASEQTRGQRSLSVPAGSMALAQLHHQDTAGGASAQLAYGTQTVPFAALGAGSAEARMELVEDAYLTVQGDDGTELGSWFIDVVPDAPPAVSFAGKPEATHRGVMRLAYDATDDYGVAELALLLASSDRPEEVERLGIVKPASQPPQLASSSFMDLTAHPLAGLKVQLRLEAVDGRGQAGRSEPLEMVLPAREFRHPLARAVIDQRRELARDPATSPDVAGRLAALAETDTAQTLPTTVPLSLRVAAARLSFNQSPDSRHEVIDLLWQLALFIEDGALSVAERKLRELQEQLQRALQEGARDAEIERMLDELQQALNEFMEQMQRDALSQMQRGDQPPQALPPNAELVEQRDLQEMLDRARELLRSGAKDAAREMLAQLQQMLENLRMAQPSQQQPSQGEQALSDLQKMIQMQQQLLERSFQMDRQQRNGEGQQEGEQQQGQQQGRQQGQRQGQQRGQQQGQQGQQGSQGEMGQAAAEQEALRRALGELMRRLGDAGMEIPRALGQAELEMRNARSALESAEPGTAAEAQTEAVDSMQQAGQSLMQQLQEQMAQQQGEGPGGQPMARPGRQGRDPLGRSTRNEGGFDTHGTQVPDESALGQARDVLEELYRRAGDQRRPPAELDYYRRLLNRF